MSMSSADIRQRFLSHFEKHGHTVVPSASLIADDPTLLGLYDGIPLTERDSTYAGAMPDRIFVYRNPTLEICETEEDVVEEVGITVVHEIAHHFGIEDDRLHELGYA